MDLIGSVRRWAFARPRLLLVEAPGATEVRLAVERLVRERGWSLAESAADADVLVEVGRLRGALVEVADVVERQMAGPFVRLSLLDAGQVCRLDELPDQLANWVSAGSAPGSADLPMADRAEDRDGLKLDVLRVPLGPVLPYWPAGLRVVVELQGDIVQKVEVDALGVASGADSYWSGHGRARGVNAAARLVGAAGWASMSGKLGVLRDRLIAGEQPSRCDEVVHRVRRSMLLRSALVGLGTVPGAGDAFDRLARWLVEGSSGAGTRWREWLPETLVGRELGEASLIVASMDIDTAEASVGDRGA